MYQYFSSLNLKERKLQMKNVLICLIILCLVAPCFADDTIYCPKDAKERVKQCDLAKKKIPEINETIQNWNPMVNDGNMMMYRINTWKGESRQQYTTRVKSMKSFYYKGLNYPIRGKFTKDNVTYIPLTRQESESVLRRAFQSQREVGQQMKFVQQKTNALKPMIRSKITRLERERQRHTLFLAQCCGYRWTTEGKPLKPRPNGNVGNGKGLLGEEAAEQRHPDWSIYPEKNKGR